jgi:hypothetical protein
MNPYAPLSFAKWLALGITLISLRRRLSSLQPAFKRVYTENQLAAIKVLRSNIRAKQRIYNRWFPVYNPLV